MELVTTHLDRLGPVVNLSKSQLVPSQTTIYLGTCLNSSSMITTLSDDRIQSLHTCLRLFQPGLSQEVVTFQRLLGLMAAALHINVLELQAVFLALQSFFQEV